MSGTTSWRPRESKAGGRIWGSGRNGSAVELRSNEDVSFGGADRGERGEGKETITMTREFELSEMNAGSGSQGRAFRNNAFMS